jgi:outer membrane protein assembly factor BamA
MKLTLTMGGLYTFKLNPDNPLLSRSSMPFSIGYSTNGSLQVSVRANVYGKDDRLRLTGEYWLKYMPDNYWGVGYKNGRYTEVSDSTTHYQRNWGQFKFKVVYRIIPNFFLGINYDRNRTDATELNPRMQEDPDFLKYGDKIRNSGFGLVIRYDSRDFPENAYRGVLLELAGTAYGKHTSSANVFQAYELDYRHYQQIKRKGSTLAWQLKTRNATGDVPWTDLSMVGTPFDLRGYPWGRYRDHTMFFALTEYRYMLPRKEQNSRGDYYGPFGFVVWSGIGTVAKNYGDIKYWIPNAGVGLRFELQARMNIRVDYGFGTGSNAFYISFTEAF